MKEQETFAQKELRRIAELEAAGLLNRIKGYGDLNPIERRNIALGKKS